MNNSRPRRNVTMDPKIVIIGAGPSGIAAATKLLELGFKNVVIVEAEDRIGGRISTVKFGSNVVDMGAQWCHGEKKNVVYEMASKYNLFDSSQAQYNVFDSVRSNKECLPKYLTDRLTAVIKQILEDAQEDLQKMKGISLGTYLCKRYEEFLKLPENSHIDNELAAQFLHMYQKYESSVEACDTLFDVSGHGFLTYWECEGDQLLNWKDRGYKTILDILMGKYPEGPSSRDILENRILLNKKVDKIVWGTRENDRALIRCEDGDSIEADHVICTMSLGVLKERHTQIFSPKLPIDKVRAIEALELGTVDKMFLEFEKPFWPAGWVGFMLVWTKEDLQIIRRGKDNWLEDVFGFFMVDYQPNVLCGWIGGVNARRMEMAPEKDVISGLVFLLRKFLDWEVPDPVGFKRSTWYTNPNFRGSYSFYTMRAEQLGANQSHLAKPLSRHTDGPPVLLFAGEATHDHYYSTVHGAIETGWREAHRLGSYYSSSKKKQEVEMPLNAPQIFDVIIIGSGLAGLGAAHALKDSNIKFTILEAQEYVGGRVKSTEMKNLRFDCTVAKMKGLVDVGAQWLHGEQNSLHNIANKNELILDVKSEEGLGSYFREDGYVFDDFFRKKIDFEIGKILTECEKFASNNAKDYPKSVEHYLEDEFRKYVETLTTDEEKKLAWQVYDWHKRFQIIDNSSLSLDQVSAKYWGMYSFNGESCQAHINFKDGFSSVVNAIVKEIDTKKIKLNSEVVEIDWEVLNRDDKLVSVRTFGGQTYLAKCVLVTCSLGVLKQNHKQLFRPNLPERMEVAINQIGFETINKIFLQFDHPWWEPMEGIQLVYNSGSDYTNSKWTRYISGFDILSPGSPNTLIGWVGSHGANEMEKLSNVQIIDDCLAILRTFTRKNVPYPVRFECSRWGSNENVRGGYSYLSTKCDESGFNGTTLSTPITIEDLPSKTSGIVNGITTLSMNGTMTNGTAAESSENTYESETISPKTTIMETTPLETTTTTKLGITNNEKRPIILFAGEACHPKYFSTAHGAFLSGIEQAQTILKNA